MKKRGVKFVCSPHISWPPPSLCKALELQKLGSGSAGVACERSWVGAFPSCEWNSSSLVLEPKITRETVSEIPFLSSYCLPPLEPPITWTAISSWAVGATVEATSRWQVEMLADGSSVALEGKRQTEKSSQPGKALNRPRWGIRIGLCSHALPMSSGSWNFDSFSSFGLSPKSYQKRCLPSISTIHSFNQPSNQLAKNSHFSHRLAFHIEPLENARLGFYKKIYVI